jgi:hypothetical protein
MYSRKRDQCTDPGARTGHLSAARGHDVLGFRRPLVRRSVRARRERCCSRCSVGMRRGRDRRDDRALRSVGRSPTRSTPVRVHARRASAIARRAGAARGARRVRRKHEVCREPDPVAAALLRGVQGRVALAEPLIRGEIEVEPTDERCADADLNDSPWGIVGVFDGKTGDDGPEALGGALESVRGRYREDRHELLAPVAIDRVVGSE